MQDILKKFKKVISSFQIEYSLFDRTIDGKFNNLLKEYTELISETSTTGNCL
jgi:hypothetical protein